MPPTPSSMLALGTPAPAFSLPDTLSGRMLGLADLQAECATLVMFICNHCPYVKHVNAELVRLAQDYQRRGVALVAISSNDATAYPEDGPEQMTRTGRELGYPFPYLHDPSQDVARAYSAACTPDFFLFDAGLRLAYRGRLDGSTPGNGLPVTGADLRAALDALLSGRAVDERQQPSLGCSIKFRKGS
ncbi:thioredoxin family protein [Solimonas sp. K1W22B-7]|uniref:thioredoxin family protein n=1 Tax=Solimonas sp. K1W22B-7 TaxID=2303331 RepID=UPI000E331BD6|nr:thioredoxin family protein [Solimonas sp. K1W22B-7]AXQ30951.1 thioredoxin family protein [Solimonas sp. K1W22B-7]